MAAASHLRQINQRKIIQAMMRLKSASRAQLSREAGLSQPTVGRIVNDLLKSFILTETPENETPSPAPDQQPQLGRPSTSLQLDRSRRRFLTIQVGVNHTRLATLPMAVSDADAWEASFPTPPNPKEFSRALEHALKLVPVRGLQACVISLPGVVDEKAGKVLLSPNLHWTEKADFTSIIRTFTRAPLLFIQEIRALALGQLAAEPNMDDFLLVDFGSGVGAAAVVGGKLYEAPLPLSGELGHTPVVGNTRQCSCGSIGCVETLVSSGGIVASAKQNGGPRTWSALVEQLQSGPLPSWLTTSLDAAATTIAGGMNVLGVRQVLLTGAVREIPPAVDYLTEAVKRGAMWGRFGEVRCRLAPRRRMAGMVARAIECAMFKSAGITAS